MGMKLPFDVACVAHKLLEPVPEHTFAPPRKWAFDWCWPEWRLAVEIEGGAWIAGRHTRAQGFIKDMEKYNAAAVLGWRVLRFTPQQIESGACFLVIKEAIKRSCP